MIFKKVFLSILLLFAVLSNSKAQTNLEALNEDKLKIIESIISNLSDQELKNLAECVENSDLLKTQANHIITIPFETAITLSVINGVLVCAVLGLSWTLIKNLARSRRRHFDFASPV